jgi:hypothetical protein
MGDGPPGAGKPTSIAADDRYVYVTYDLSDSIWYLDTTEQPPAVRALATGQNFVRRVGASASRGAVWFTNNPAELRTQQPGASAPVRQALNAGGIQDFAYDAALDRFVWIDSSSGQPAIYTDPVSARTLVFQGQANTFIDSIAAQGGEIVFSLSVAGDNGNTVIYHASLAGPPNHETALEGPFLKNFGGVRGVAVNDSQFVWAVKPTTQSSDALKALARQDGGTPTPLANDCVDALIAKDNFVYWNACGSLRRVLPPGSATGAGSPTLDLTEASANTFTHCIAAGGSWLYWGQGCGSPSSTPGPGAIWRVAR